MSVTNQKRDPTLPTKSQLLLRPAISGCVGCYRIEGPGAQLFSRIEGSQFTVLGLPLLAVLDYLRVRKVMPS